MATRAVACKLTNSYCLCLGDPYIALTIPSRNLTELQASSDIHVMNAPRFRGVGFKILNTKYTCFLLLCELMRRTLLYAILLSSIFLS